MKFTMTGSELSSTVVRTHRSECGKFGKVTRTRRNSLSGECWETRTRFFLWSNPDHEYETLIDAVEDFLGKQ